VYNNTAVLLGTWILCLRTWKP